MTKNPYLNALAAAIYIVVIVLVMQYGIANHGDREETIVVPIVILSLFTLSAAMMGYIFLFQPIRMYLDGAKSEAVDLFLKTVAGFAGLTILIIFIMFSGIF